MGDLRTRIQADTGTKCYVNVPASRPETFVTVTREGGARENRLIDRPGVGIYCYAPTEAKAWALAESVADLMETLPFADGYATVEQEAMYSDPDPDTRDPRWYLSYTIRTYEPPSAAD